MGDDKTREVGFYGDLLVALIIFRSLCESTSAPAHLALTTPRTFLTFPAQKLHREYYVSEE